MLERAAGILLHPASLPGPHGIGDLGAAAGEWLEWLAKAGQGIWQVLPLGPVGGSGSPYDGPSTTAGEPLLIGLGELVRGGLLEESDLRPAPGFSDEALELEGVRCWKAERLDRAWKAFRELPPKAPLAREEAAWAAAPEQAGWLEDWTLYSALRHHHGGPWTGWPAGLRQRRSDELAAARRVLAEPIGRQRFLQFLFWRQWAALRRHAAERGVRVLGDLPIYCALDSAEVWCRQELFDLDAEGRPNHLSGVPPDAYSDDGQLWRHPLYRWEQLREEGYSWWIERLRLACRRADLVRLDHFRGFAGFWEVPAGAETAAGGRWQQGPGRELFDAARRALGGLPLVAEDLGEITDDVRELRRGLGLPGMRVLQFGLGSGDEEHQPRSWTSDVVAYTGTHDNDTSRGWFAGLEPETRERILAEIGGDAGEIHWAMLRAVWSSRARIAMAPVQDLLGLGSPARLNTPGRAAGNWRWRLPAGALTPALARRLRRLTELTRRTAARPETAE